MKVALSSSDTSVLARATQRSIPEYAILHGHRRENLNSYKKKKQCLVTKPPEVRKTERKENFLIPA
jgi:hypothetical protein